MSFNKESLRKLSEEITADFYTVIDKTYDINEKCIAAKLSNADFQTLCDMIYKKLVENNF